jgi:hypothetical protein
VSFCVMCVTCALCLTVVPLPPGKTPFAIKIIKRLRILQIISYNKKALYSTIDELILSLDINTLQMGIDKLTYLPQMKYTIVDS